MKKLIMDYELNDSAGIADTLAGAFPTMKYAMLRQMTDVIMEEANRIIYRAVGYDIDKPNENKYLEAKQKLSSLTIDDRREIATTAIRELCHNPYRVQQLLDKAKQEKRIIV